MKQWNSNAQAISLCLPEDLNQIPQEPSLPRMDQYITNYHIQQWIVNLYEEPQTGWPSWAEHDLEMADHYFSQPYTIYAQTNFGYTAANAMYIARP